MPIELELIDPAIYVFHWTGIVRVAEAAEQQQAAIDHARANNVPHQFQIVNMSNLQSVAWNLTAFRDIVQLNPTVLCIMLVQPPRYILMGTRAIHTFSRDIDLEIEDDYDRAVQKALDYMQAREHA